MLANDVSLRNLIPGELAKGFGFFQSKPATAFSPVAVTPDELGAAWREAKLHRPLLVHLNGKLFGRPDAGTDMTFDFGQLIAHAARTRRLSARQHHRLRHHLQQGGGRARPAGGRGRHRLCLHRRAALGGDHPHRPAGDALSQVGDQVRIEMLEDGGASIFGAIEQTVTPISATGT